MATICERVTGKGRHWQAKIRRLGYPELSQTFSTRAAAEAWARKVESELERGVWRDTSAADRTTLLACLKRYEQEVTPRKRSPGRELSHIRILQELDIVRTAMSRVRGADLARVRDDWVAANLAPATIVRRLAVLSHVFETARKEWGMESLANPCRALKAPVVRNARERRISDEEINAICEASPSSEMASMVRVALETAMRRGELCALRWENVDFRTQVAWLPLTKNGESRAVPLSSKALSALRELPRHLDGRVCSMQPDSVTQAFERSVEKARKTYLKQCKESGLRPDSSFLVDLRFHDLRHEATNRLSDRLQLHELAAVTGHKDLRMLKRYYHPRASDLAKKLG